jgi:hypothetical protein
MFTPHSTIHPMRRNMRPRGCIDEGALVWAQSIITMETRYRFQDLT